MSDDYDVGYGKPPKHSQWPKGQSGNPKGRPKGTRNFKTDLKEELDERIQISEGGKVQVVSKQRALVKRTMEKALNGNIRATELLIKWASQYLEMAAESDEMEQLAPDDAAILEHYKARGTADGNTNDGQGGSADGGQ